MCKHGTIWELVMEGRNCGGPRIWRTTPDWDDSMIDYILFDAEVLGNLPSTGRGKLTSIRFLAFPGRYARFSPVGGSMSRYRNAFVGGAA